MYADSEIVTENSVAIGKLKNSKKYDSAVSDRGKTGAIYPHISIRAISTPECNGCYKTTRDGAIDWGKSYCGACSENLKIYFFQLTMQANDNGEVSENDAASSEQLPVNFEFDIGGKLFVTTTTKMLARVSDGNGNFDPVHNNPSVPPLASTVTWPLTVTIDLKQFEVICSLNSAYTCPYEGNLNSQLAVAEETGENSEKKSTYSFRTAAGNRLFVKMDRFKIASCIMIPVIANPTLCTPGTPFYQGVATCGPVQVATQTD